MRTIKELNGIKSIQSVVILFLHAVGQYFLPFPIEAARAASFGDDPPPPLASVAQYVVTIWPKSQVEPFFVVSGILLTMSALELLDCECETAARDRKLGGKCRLRLLQRLMLPWLKSVARRAVRYWIVGVPLVLLFAVYTSRLDGAVHCLLYINNYNIEGQIAMTLWTNASTIQAAVLLPVYIVACDIVFVHTKPISQNAVFLRRAACLLCALILTSILRWGLVWAHVPKTPWEHHYGHPGPVMPPAILEQARRVRGVDKFVWEDSPEALEIVRMLPMFQYFHFHMRVAAFFAGAIAGAAIHHSVKIGERRADALCAFAFVFGALLDRYAEGHRDRRVYFMFSMTCAHIPLAAMLYAAVTKQGAVGRALSWILTSRPLQRFAPFTLCLYVYHAIILCVMIPHLTADLSEPSFQSARAVVVLVCMACLLVAVIAHRFLEAPAYIRAINMCRIQRDSHKKV